MLSGQIPFLKAVNLNGNAFTQQSKLKVTIILWGILVISKFIIILTILDTFILVYILFVVDYLKNSLSVIKSPSLPISLNPLSS